MPELSDTLRPGTVQLTGVGIRYRRYLKKITTIKEAVVSLFQGSHYESFWALRGLDLELRRGSALGVIGPNGSGKSTLLKAIAGVLPPSEGTVRVAGRIVPLLELGAGFRPDLTGRENVYLNGAILGLSRAQMEERFDRIVEFSEIGDFIDAPLHTYSSGMKARLGFAVATDVDPEVLLLDEIFSVGDASFKAKALARTESFFGGNTTVVVVSHAMGQIRRLCEQTLYLNKGRLVAAGPTEEVIAQYLSDAGVPA